MTFCPNHFLGYDADTILGYFRARCWADAYGDIPRTASGLYLLAERMETERPLYVGQTNLTLRRRWAKHFWRNLFDGAHQRLYWIPELAGDWVAERHAVHTLQPRLNQRLLGRSA